MSHVFLKTLNWQGAAVAAPVVVHLQNFYFLCGIENKGFNSVPSQGLVAFCGVPFARHS